MTNYLMSYAHEATSKAYWNIRYARIYLEQVCSDTQDTDACSLAEDLTLLERRLQELVEKFHQRI